MDEERISRVQAAIQYEFVATSTGAMNFRALAVAAVREMDAVEAERKAASLTQPRQRLPTWGEPGFAELSANISPLTKAVLEAQNDKGWLPWILPGGPFMSMRERSSRPSPYQHKQVWIMRDEWSAPQLVDPNTLPAEMNAVGLNWRAAQTLTPAGS